MKKNHTLKLIKTKQFKKSKRFLFSILILATLFNTSNYAKSNNDGFKQLEVKSYNKTISVNGENYLVPLYNVNNDNYIKLRDLAYMLNYSTNQFDVLYDQEKDAINIKKDSQYTVTGSEMTFINDPDINISLNESSLYVDYENVFIESYNINDTNYFKLRDLSSVIGFNFNFNENNIMITTIIISTKNNVESKTMGLITKSDKAYEGYTLFTPRHYNTTYLINIDGELVHSWDSDYRVEHATLLENGLLLRGVETVNPLYDGLAMIHERMEMVDTDNNVVWFYEYATEDYVLHHDFMMLPNGNILMSAYDIISREEAILNGRDPSTLNDDILPDSLIELKPDYENGGGTIVWEWHVFDHIIQDFDETKENFGDVYENKQLIDFNYFRQNFASINAARDWNHVSGIDYNEELDLIVLSMHINDEIIIIDHSTTTDEAKGHTGGNYNVGGDIVYRFGNEMAYDDTKSAKHFNTLHDPRFISNNEIMVLNNNYTGSNSYLEIIKIPDDFDIKKDFDIEEEVEIEVLYDDFHTRNIGGGEILPNGNVLIFESVTGTIIEIDENKDVVFEYIIPVSNNGALTQGEEIPATRGGDLYNEYYIAYRLSADFKGLEGYDLTKKGTIEK